MKATCVSALLANICFLTATVDCSKELGPASSWLSEGPFCSRMCDGGEGQFVDEMFPPYRCSCSKSCTVFGDCCYDSPYIIAESLQQYEFVCISVIKRSGYRAVSSCPPGKYHHSCKANLGLLPPVTSTETNITYANRYCAWGNEDKSNLITWNVDLSCASSEDDLIDDSNDRIEYSSGEFWMKNTLQRTKRQCRFKVRNGDFRTIDGLELRPCVTVNMISKCPRSWKDPVSAEKCASYEDPVFLYNTIYRNPFCAHCNFINLRYLECVPHHLRTTLEGRRIIDDDVIQYCLTHSCHLDLGNGQFTTFRSIFDPTIFELLCPKGERYDPNMLQCRKIHN